jgi:hypothetical protein
MKIMKIYVTNIPPSSIKANFEKMDKYLINKNGYKKYEIFSEEFGIYVIEDKNDKKASNQKIYRIEPTLNTDLHLIKNYNGYDLLFDKTNYVEQNVISQFPVNYMLTKLTCFEYILNPSSQNKIKLTLECIVENNIFMDKENTPVNYYFSCLKSNNNIDNNNNNNNIDNNLLEEINVFLSELI